MRSPPMRAVGADLTSSTRRTFDAADCTTNLGIARAAAVRLKRSYPVIRAVYDAPARVYRSIYPSRVLIAGEPTGHFSRRSSKATRQWKKPDARAAADLQLAVNRKRERGGCEYGRNDPRNRAARCGTRRIGRDVDHRLRDIPRRCSSG